MHKLIATRGNKWWVDRFMEQLGATYVPWKYRPAGTKEILPCNWQIGVRPMQIWEIVYPSEMDDVINNTLWRGGTGIPNHRFLDKFVLFIRKLLKLKPIKENYKTNQFLACQAACENFEIIHLGDKDDYWVDANDVKHEEKVEGSFEGL